MSANESILSKIKGSIQIQPRDVYGETNVYPVCDQAKEFATIAGTKTLTINTLASVLRLGFTLIELNRYGQVARVHVPGSGHELCELGAR